MCRIIRGIILCKKNYPILLKKMEVTFISFCCLYLEKKTT